ncbi:hypothetical protein AB3G45_05885 [Shinella sp. S4-D37]|uniref:hypothetical protein n=1 Tax=Shinella sp. S4-D37 TaxID=3161999 RepID=UPI003465F6CD
MRTAADEPVGCRRRVEKAVAALRPGLDADRVRYDRSDPSRQPEEIGRRADATSSFNPICGILVFPLLRTDRRNASGFNAIKGLDA